MKKVNYVSAEEFKKLLENEEVIDHGFDGSDEEEYVRSEYRDCGNKFFSHRIHCDYSYDEDGRRHLGDEEHTYSVVEYMED